MSERLRRIFLLPSSRMPLMMCGRTSSPTPTARRPLKSTIVTSCTFRTSMFMAAHDTRLAARRGTARRRSAPFQPRAHREDLFPQELDLGQQLVDLQIHVPRVARTVLPAGAGEVPPQARSLGSPERCYLADERVAPVLLPLRGFPEQFVGGDVEDVGEGEEQTELHVLLLGLDARERRGADLRFC